MFLSREIYEMPAYITYYDKKMNTNLSSTIRQNQNLDMIWLGLGQLCNLLGINSFTTIRYTTYSIDLPLESHGEMLKIGTE